MQQDQEPLIIDGIYNYCDRWCERCDFIYRCRVGLEELEFIEEQKAEEESRALMKSLDLPLPDAWAENTNRLDGIKDTLEKTVEMLNQLTEESELTMTEDEQAASLQACRNKRMAKEARLDDEPLKARSNQYGHEVHRLFAGGSEIELAISEKVNLMLLTSGQDDDASIIQSTVEAIKDATEVIQWFGFFLTPKFVRALEGKQDADQEAWFAENGFQSDADGSAKVGLIAVSRSMEAWQTLLRLMPAIEDSAITMLALLQQIKTEAEARFPHAWLFRRPGFDD